MSFLDWLFGSGDSTTTTKVDLPPWYEDAAKSTLKQAMNAGDWYAQPYQGDTYANLNGQQREAIGAARNNVGSTNAAYRTAMSGTQGVMNYDPSMVQDTFDARRIATNYDPSMVRDNFDARRIATNYDPSMVKDNFAAKSIATNYDPSMVKDNFAAKSIEADNVKAGYQNYNYRPDRVNGGSFLNMNVDRYMNPNIQAVEKAALRNLDKSRLNSLNEVADAAIGARAGFGSRQGVVEGVTNANAAQAAGELSANIRNDAFNSATQRMEQDMQRKLQAGLANQSTGLNNAQFNANVGLQNVGNRLNASLANQGANLQANQFNQQQRLADAQLNMQGQLANQQAGLQGAQLNQNASMFNQQQRLADAQLNMQGQLANQQAGLQGAQLNQNASMFNQQQRLADAQLNMQGQLANQQAGLQGAQLNQNASMFNQQQRLADAQLNMQGQLANQQAGLQGAQLNLNAANQYGQLASNKQADFLTGLQASLAGGNMLQADKQGNLTQEANQYNSLRQYPVDILNMQLSALNGTQLPTGQSTTTSNPSSPLMSLLGLSMAGASMLPMSLLGGLGGFSDRNEKTNIQKLGKDPDTGLDVYAYDYKADVEAARKSGTPMPMKRVGPMAQDIEKMHPGATKKIGGKMVVNLGIGG